MFENALGDSTSLPSKQMYTVIETPTFTEDSKLLWSEEDRSAFCVWLCA